MTAIVSPPGRSLDQRMDALERGNVVRSARAQLKRDLKAGSVSIVDTLLEPPEYAETMKVFAALLACPMYGRVKVTKILQLARISPAKTIGGLSMRQRGQLVSMLRRQRPLAAPPCSCAALANLDPDAQHMRALREANGTRLARAALKAKIADGLTTVEEVLRDLPHAAESMTIANLLMAQHRWGQTRASRFLASIPMLETKTIGSMTSRQRDALQRRLGEPEHELPAAAPTPADEPLTGERVHLAVTATATGASLHLHHYHCARTVCGYAIQRLWSPGLNDEWTDNAESRCRRCEAIAADIGAAIDD